MQVVERGLGLNPHVARLGRLDFGMFAASVVERDDLAIVRAPLVRADAEHFAQITLQRDEEPAGGAQIARRGLGGQRLGAARALIPALRGLGAAQRGQHMATGQIECAHRVIDILRSCGGLSVLRPHRFTVGRLRIRCSGIRCLIRGIDLARGPGRFHVPCIRNARVTGLGFGGRPETFLQPRIIRVGADGVGHRQVGRQQTVLPWNPFRRAQRLFHGNKR